MPSFHLRLLFNYLMSIVIVMIEMGGRVAEGS